MPARLRLALFVAGLLAARRDRRRAAVRRRRADRARPRASPAPCARRASRRRTSALRDERGDPLRLADMRGKPVVVTFLYTTCKDTCPLTAQQIRIALDDLGHDVPVVAVSVDPANDTPRARAGVPAQAGPAGPHALGAGQRRASCSGCGAPTASSRRPTTPSTPPRRSCSTSAACSASASRRAC